MKIERFNENHEYDVKINELNNALYAIIFNELELEPVEISYDSVRNACNKIISYFGD